MRDDEHGVLVEERQATGGDRFPAHVLGASGADVAESGGVAAALGGEVGSGKIFVMGDGTSLRWHRGHCVR
ncbi:hypothetical protein ACFV0L_44360, partial [Streptosporangium canum]|uniref:hypothetical protein n=1 Tax=Streptosporangium canum TaxID=324952 RepID=UPI003685EEFD